MDKESSYQLDKNYKWRAVNGQQLKEASIKGPKNAKYVELKLRFCADQLLNGSRDLDDLNNVKMIFGVKK